MRVMLLRRTLEDGRPRADDIIVGKRAEFGTRIIVDTRL